MAKEETGGVWRTIGGRRVFIKDGQSLADAMKESGKFNTSKTKSSDAKAPDEKQENKSWNETMTYEEYRMDLAKERYEKGYDASELSEAELEDIKKYGEQRKKEKEDYEYKLYKKAMTNPESIDPMTENSTDWEALDKKYKSRYEKEIAKAKAPEDEKFNKWRKENDPKKEWTDEKAKEIYENSKPVEWGLKTKSGEEITKENYKDREFKASMGEVDIPDDFNAQFNDYAKQHDDLRLAKEKALENKKNAENKWIEHYNNSNWNDENWRKEDDRLSQERDKSREEYDKAMKEYLAVANDSELSWQDKVSRNDIQMEKELEEIKSQRGKGKYYNPDTWDEDYYGTFRKYEKENAKLKAEGAKPDEEYVPLNSYGTYSEKRHKLEGIEKNANGTYNYDTMKDATWTGKEYTNDEFMENLEDENWHTERRMIQTAGLTNQEVEYIKDNTTFHNGSPSLNRESTQKLIDEAKAKFRNKSVDKGYRWRDENGEIIKPSKSFKNIGGGDYVKQNEDGSSIHIASARQGDGSTAYYRYDYDKNGNAGEMKVFKSLTEAKAGKTKNEAMNDKIRTKATKTSKSKDPFHDEIVQSNYQRYSGTIDYLKDMGLSSSQISQIIDKLKKDEANKK